MINTKSELFKKTPFKKMTTPSSEDYGTSLNKVAKACGFTSKEQREEFKALILEAGFEITDAEFKGKQYKKIKVLLTELGKFKVMQYDMEIKNKTPKGWD
jgi:hypothetical protein